MIKVLLTDNYDSFTYNIAQLLKESKLCRFEIIKNDEVNVNEISYFDKILFSPGPGLPEDAGKMPLVIETFYKTKSILGICLGMQAIAEFFGAELYNLEHVFHGIKTNTQIIEPKDILFKNIPEHIETGLYHSWAVRNNLSGTGLIPTAVSQEGVLMGVSHELFDIKGVQFHPESILTPFGQQIINNWLSA